MFNKYLKIGNINVTNAIIQGGMAIRISTACLAGNVAKNGGIGVIAGTAMTPKELKEEIIEAKKISEGKGAIGLNVLFAVKNFSELVQTAMKNGIDVVFSGAGFSRDIFDWGKNFNVPIVSIVSSGRLAKLAEKLGAAAVVAESCQAGGHLGTKLSLDKVVPDVKAATKLPVIAAGGIVDGYDIYRVEKMGVDGVQMGTRFAASTESNASSYFKNLYLNSKKNDTVYINSSVGLPGRALKNSFVNKLISDVEIKIEKCENCLKKCTKSFCIKKSLINAQKGIEEDALVFAGENVYKINEILSVKDIFKKLQYEYNKMKHQEEIYNSEVK